MNRIFKNPLFRLKTQNLQKINLENIKLNNIKPLIGQSYINNEPNYFLTHSIIKNPKWHSAYSAYQSEISQGRLNMFNYFQELIKKISNKDLSNSSMLDDNQALLDAINMLTCDKKQFEIIADENLYDVRKKILSNYAEVLNWKLTFTNLNRTSYNENHIYISQSVNSQTGFINNFQSPNHIHFLDPKYALIGKNVSADIHIGHLQNFGLPLMIGGPNVGFISANYEFLRKFPGKMVIPSFDINNEPKLRLGVQTREQHIKREKALSNICTNQSLMATYVVSWTALHSLKNIRKDVLNVKHNTEKIYSNLFYPTNNLLDTISFQSDAHQEIYYDLFINGYEVYQKHNNIQITFDWTLNNKDYKKINNVLSKYQKHLTPYQNNETFKIIKPNLDFLNFKNELDAARYLQKQTDKDFTLVDGLIPLGSCTMKYNPMHIFKIFDHPHILSIHPQSYQTKYIKHLFEDFKKNLSILTGFNHVSLQPLSGSHGELAALFTIKRYFQNERKYIILPKSCHGTNATSVKIAGFTPLIFDDTIFGINFAVEVEKLVLNYKNEIAGIMITFPNTLGFFDENVIDALKLIHEIGGINYMDGANMNALVGILDINKLGFDICHLNLHKTFAVPHGGGGPGAGPILCNDKLKKFLPNENKYRFSSSLYGNSIANLMSYLYLSDLSFKKIKQNSYLAIKNANYLKELLKNEFSILTDKDGNVSHELIIKTNFLQKIDINEIDFCKRLIDYGIHPPTVNWPIPRCLMIEPTETETKENLDYLAQTLINIKNEILNNSYNLKLSPTNPKYSLRINEVESDKNLMNKISNQKKKEN